MIGSAHLRGIAALLGAMVCVAPATAIAQDAAGDVKIAEAFAASIAKDGKVGTPDLIDSNVVVETLLRNPFTRSFIPKHSGNGLSALTEQTDGLFKALGRPKGKSCNQQQTFVACRFEYPLPTSAWLAAVTVSGSKIVKISYIYVTPSDVDAFRSQK